MRYLFFLTLFTLPAFSQIDVGDGSSGACTNLTIQNGGTHNCTTLNLSGSVTFTDNSPALIIKVQGDVTINASIILDGKNGAPLSASGDGGAGGPGADAGGGRDIFDSPQAGTGGSLSAGGVGDNGITCGSGGGGAGFTTDGENGFPCDGSGGQKGLAVDPGEFDFSNPASFRGGFGGGAGGEASADVGSGGGGGGGIHIMAGGNILINGTISSKGGQGGSPTSNGGGGGGGSGGVIWIESLGQITNNALFTLTGGPGGSSSGGKGGTGASGVYKMSDVDNVIEGIGTGTSNSGQNLNSSISCGSVASEEKDSNFFFQLIAGFSLILIWKKISRRLLKFFA